MIDAGRYASLTLRYRVCASPDLAAAFGRAYAPCRTDVDGAVDLELTLRDDAFPDPNTCLLAAMSDIDQATIRVAASDMLVFHASAAQSAAGSVLLIGPSGAGKTTTAAGLAAQGWSYAGDEAIGIDEGATTLFANPKPFKLDRNSCAALGLGTSGLDDMPAVFEELVVAPEEFGPSLAPDAAPLPAAIVHLAFASAAPNTITPLSRPETAELLAGQCFNFAQWRSRALDSVVRLARAVPGYQLDFATLPGAIGGN